MASATIGSGLWEASRLPILPALMISALFMCVMRSPSTRHAINIAHACTRTRRTMTVSALIAASSSAGSQGYTAMLADHIHVMVYRSRRYSGWRMRHALAVYN